MNDKPKKEIYKRWWFWVLVAVLMIATPSVVHWYQAYTAPLSSQQVADYIKENYKPSFAPIPANMTFTGSSGYANADSAMTIDVLQSAGIISETSSSLLVLGPVEFDLTRTVTGNSCGFTNSGAAGGPAIPDGTSEVTVNAPINSRSEFTITCESPDGNSDWANQGTFTVSVFDKSQYGQDAYMEDTAFSPISLPQ